MEKKEKFQIKSPKIRFVVSAIREYPPYNAKVLDFGCGHGRFSYSLASLGYDVLGVDISEEAISFAKSRNVMKNCKFKAIKNVESIKGDYDVVLLLDVLEHVAEPDRLLKRINLMMKNNSLLILTVPNGYGHSEALDRLINICRKIILLRVAVKRYGQLLRKLFPYNRTVESRHQQYFSLTRLRSLLNINGFKIISLENGTFLSSIQHQLFPYRTPESFIDLDHRFAQILPSYLAENWWILAEKGDTKTDKN